MLENIPANKGTYLLHFQNHSASSVVAGSKGQVDLLPGYYFYIGSAFGSGGLRARLKHHLGISQRPHWHLDYLRPKLAAKDIWYSVDETRYEHVWADSLYYTLNLHVPVDGLGSSDCKCKSHFFYTKNKLSDQLVLEALKNQQLESLEKIEVV